MSAHAIGPDNVASPEQMRVLTHARDLSMRLTARWSRPPKHDDVMLLVADLLEAHADTGIEMQTWPRALDVVMAHLAADPVGRAVLEEAGVTPWFTVVGIWSAGKARPLAAIPGRRHLETTMDMWQRQVQAPCAACAARSTEEG